MFLQGCNAPILTCTLLKVKDHKNAVKFPYFTRKLFLEAGGLMH